MEDRKKFLLKIKKALLDAHGERLRGVVLYGSEARGDAAEDSDIDLLVLLEGPIQLWKDIQKNIEAIYNIQLEVIRPIHVTPVDIKAFNADECALYRIAKKEGVFT